MVLYVHCFGISFFTVSPSVCLEHIYLGLGSLVATFRKELLIRSTMCSLCYVFLLLCLFPIFDLGSDCVSSCHC